MSYLLECGKSKFGNHLSDYNMIEYWEMSGLLHGVVDGNLRLQLATKLDKLGEYLVNIKIPLSVDGYEGFDLISFPIIRRIHNECIEHDTLWLFDKLDVEDIFEILLTVYIDSIKLVKKIFGDGDNIDHVAIAVSIISEQLYQKYKLTLENN